jgi:hypothetical protein
VNLPAATIDGRAVAEAEAIARGAVLLGEARRVLVTGLTDASLEAIVAACDLAEAIGAAIDAGDDDTASPAGPLIARIGDITADPGELDRAELVIAWFCPADAAWPSLPDCRRLAVGPEPLAGWEQVPLAADAAVDAASLVHALLVDQGGGARDLDPEFVAGCEVIAATIAAAGCVAFLAPRDADPLGLAHWTLARLVRFLAHDRPTFIVPHGRPAAGQLDNAAGVATVLSWRYGAAGGIARADRGGGRFMPAECDAVRLVARGEVDAVLAVGRLPATVEEAIASRAADLAVVRLDCRGDEPPEAAGSCVHIRCNPAGGTLLGPDGRETAIAGPTTAGSLAARLGDLLRTITEQRA